MKTLLASVLLIAPALNAVSAPAPVAVEGYSHVRSADGVDEYRLEVNGLSVLVMPQADVPTATFMVTYRVGSRNEVTGTTGATHLLEHLMFKGTAAHHRGNGTSFDQVLERIGAVTNATTWLDRTNYYATVPAYALPVLIELEADRMRNLSLAEEDRRAEMTVVRNEFELGENRPMEALSKHIWAAAFMAHPYHHDTIGWRSDIEYVPIEKLRAFYNTFYWPDNATVTVIGGFDVAETLKTIKERYGSIPKSPQPFPALYTVEPPQDGERRVVLKRSGEVGIVTIAHKIPAGTHADWPAIEVLSRILAEGETSRCFRALTDHNLTIEVDGWASFTHDPSLHLLSAELAQDAKHEVVERGMVAEIESIASKGVTPGEVQTAVAGFLAERAFSQDGSFAVANAINECIAVGDWTLYATLEARMKAVTPEDVQRVARKYFGVDQSTVGWFIPTETARTEEATAKSESFKPKEVVPPAPLKEPLPPPPVTDFATRIQRTNVGGADVLVCRSAAKDIACVRVSLPVGGAKEENQALAHLTFDMTERGTTKHDKFEIAAKLEGAGVDVESHITPETVELTAKCLSRDLPMVLDLLAEEWRMPAFKPEEFKKAKLDLLSSLQQVLEDTNEQAAIAFSRATRTPGDPLRRATVDELTAAAKKATLDAVKVFHANHYGPRGMRLVVVGDVDPTAVQKHITKLLETWKPQPAEPVRPVAPMKVASTVKVPMPDKASVSVLLGQPTGLQAGDADWLALRLGNDALGFGFTSRLIGNVRDREGLTYHIGSLISEDSNRPGMWSVKASFAPSMLERGIASVRREVEQWCRDGITKDELEFRKTAMAGEYTVGLETTTGLAEQILLCVRRGFDLKWLDEYPTKVNALTLDQVNRVIKAQLDPKTMVLVEAGVGK
jgi:zinc protease